MVILSDKHEDDGTFVVLIGIVSWLNSKKAVPL